MNEQGISPTVILFLIGVLILSNYLDKTDALETSTAQKAPKTMSESDILKEQIKTDLENIEKELGEEIEEEINNFSQIEMIKASETGEMSNQLKNIVESDLKNEIEHKPDFPEPACAGFMSSSYYSLGEDYDVLKYEDIPDFVKQSNLEKPAPKKEKFNTKPKGSFAEACSFSDKIYAEFNSPR